VWVEYVNQWGEYAKAIAQDLSTQRLINKLGLKRYDIHPVSIKLSPSQAQQIADAKISENMRAKVVSSQDIEIDLIYESDGVTQVKPASVKPGKLIEFTNRQLGGSNVQAYVTNTNYEADTNIVSITLDNNERSIENIIAQLVHGKAL
jgi:hypothetical protein